MKRRNFIVNSLIAVGAMIVKNSCKLTETRAMTPTTAGSVPFGATGSLLTRDANRYLSVVKVTLDTLLAKARDTMGMQKSGMIISLLDAKTGEPLDGKQDLPKAAFGIRSYDRTGPFGSNANLQLDLYRAMFEMSRLTGDPYYAKGAGDALLDFLNITQSPITNLLAWGEHMYWDCLNDRPSEDKTHETKRKIMFFDFLYDNEPERVLRYARGLWDHQIANHETGDFSRHAKWDRHAPGTKYDFPKEGGYMIEFWGRAYEKSKEPVFLLAINTLAKRYLSRMNTLDLLNFDSTDDPERVNLCTPLWLVSLALDSTEAAARVNEETAEILKELAKRQDNGFLNLEHKPDDSEHGFLYCAYTDSGLPRPRYGTQGYSRHWEIGYGVYPTSMFALLCYSRQAQLGKSREADRYRDLVIRAANLYKKLDSDLEKHDIWAGEYGMAIFLQLAAYRLTVDPGYLERARHFADDAIRVFWGDNPLPRSSSKTGHYEAITYTDTLVYSLLALYEQLTAKEARCVISDINR